MQLAGLIFGEEQNAFYMSGFFGSTSSFRSLPIHYVTTKPIYVDMDFDNGDYQLSTLGDDEMLYKVYFMKRDRIVCME